MYKRTSDISYIFAFVSLIIFMTRKSYAYIDLGTGSYFLQIALAGFFAGLYVFKSTVKAALEKVVKFFRREKKIHGKKHEEKNK